MRFTDEHEWLTLDGDIATVGITEFATKQLGDLVFVELPKMGAKLAKGAPAAVVESVKTSSDVYAPLAGDVVELNEEVTKDPAIVNGDPLGKGWLYKIKLANPNEFETLMDEAAYNSLIAAQS